MSLRFGSNPNNRSTTLPCDSDPNYYQDIVQILSSLPRGISESTECTCFICIDGREKFLHDRKKISFDLFKALSIF